MSFNYSSLKIIITTLTLLSYFNIHAGCFDSAVSGAAEKIETSSFSLTSRTPAVSVHKYTTMQGHAAYNALVNKPAQTLRTWLDSSTMEKNIRIIEENKTALVSRNLSPLLVLDRMDGTVKDVYSGMKLDSATIERLGILKKGNLEIGPMQSFTDDYLVALRFSKKKYTNSPSVITSFLRKVLTRRKLLDIDEVIKEADAEDTFSVILEGRSRYFAQITDLSDYQNESELIRLGTKRLKVTDVEVIKDGKNNHLIHVKFEDEVEDLWDNVLSSKGYVPPNEIDPQKEILRFVNNKETDISQVNLSNVSSRDFLDTVKMINKDHENLDFSLETLLKIHRSSTKNHPFEGYFQRRGRAPPENRNNYPEDVFEFRASKEDDFVSNGDFIDEAGKRYFTEKNFSYYVSHPSFQIKNVEKVTGEGADAKIYAEFSYVGSKEVDAQVKNLFSLFEKRIKGSTTDFEYLHNVYAFEYFMLGLHPFVDGNGRALRLFSDSLLIRRGFPPSLNLDDSVDFTLSLEDYVLHRIRGMEAYLEN